MKNNNTAKNIYRYGLLSSHVCNMDAPTLSCLLDTSPRAAVLMRQYAYGLSGLSPGLR